MPLFPTYNELRIWGQQENAQTMLKEAHASATKSRHTVFLSHSSKDDDLVPGAVLILRNHGAIVYADHHDPSLASADLAAIADHLRTVIHTCKKFVMLATPRSKDSKWIPWELGLGDEARTPHNVALFPSAETAFDMQWAEQEYLGLYQRIVWGQIRGQDQNRWLVWDHRRNVAQPLGEWLSN